MEIKKIAIIIQLFAGILVLMLLGVYLFVQYNVSTIKKETYEYLLTKYDSDEIYKVQGTLGKGQLFIAIVIFEDEKDVVYEYAKKDGEIIQIYPEPGVGDYKHSSE